MKLQLAHELRNALLKACPVDSGALKGSIQQPQLNANSYIITIGNNSGKEVNGKCATNVYAGFTNDARYLKLRGKQFTNPNYHWANKAIEQWAKQNAINIALETEEKEEDE